MLLFFEDAMEAMNGSLRSLLRGLHLRLRTLAVAVCACSLLTPGISASADDNPLEYAVKAAFLYKFGIYVDWPSNAFTSPNSVLNLCVVGEDPFGASLDNAVSGQHINGHPVAIRRIRTLTRESGCHIVYLGRSDGQRNPQSVEEIRVPGLLTVSDVKGLGIINFVVKDNRVRFDIDEQAAAQNGLGISSKLLSLALNVKRRQPVE